PSDGWVPWTFTLPPGRNVDSSPAVGVDGTIYFGADDGRLYALDPNGSPRGVLSLGSAPVRSGPVIGPDGTIYVTAGGNLYAVRPDGVLKWSLVTGNTEISSPALASDGTIYFGSGSRLYAVKDNGSSGTEKWEFEAVGSVVSSPLVASNGS